MFLYSLLPVFAFLLLFVFLTTLQPDDGEGQPDNRKALIQTSLFWSAYLVLGTELLSLVHGLSRIGFVLLWVLAILLLGFMNWKTKFIPAGCQRIRQSFSNLKISWFDIFALIVVVISLVILLITGLMSPPNIHDVLAYHMSRVMHWVQNRSLAFYPTSITWQLWMPPFSEYSQLNWLLLSGGDLLSSFHQWYSLILTMVTTSLVAKRLGAQRRGQWLSALFILSLPIVVLQASGAKNDIVLGFLIGVLLFYTIEGVNARLGWVDWIACGIAVGLGVLTKGTYFVFALPLLIWLSVVMLRKMGWQKTLVFAAIGLGMVLILNAGHFIRNTRTFGTPVSTGYESSLVNNRFGFDVTVSNLSRHAAVQMNGKYGFINEGVQKGLKQVHTWLAMPLFDPEITLGPAEFYYVPTREEVAGNPFHFALTGLGFLVACFGLVCKKDRSVRVKVFLITITIFSGLLIFSAVFRWQAWSTRFFIPYYVLFAPVIGVVFGDYPPKPIAWILGFALAIVMINPLLNNYSRSFSWSAENRNSIWRMSRKGLLFANNHNIEGAVLDMTAVMDASGCRTYGVILRSNAPEYLLWATLTPGADAYYLSHVAVDNPTSVLAPTDFDPCGMVLFEVFETDRIDDTKYNLFKRWQVGDNYPFSLYLEPSYDIGQVE